MRETLTGCPEQALNPPEREEQDRINLLYAKQEAEVRIGAFLEEYEEVFPDEIQNFLDDLRMNVLSGEYEGGLA